MPDPTRVVHAIPEEVESDGRAIVETHAHVIRESQECALPGLRERAIAELAGRQHGVVARRQLTALACGRGAIDHRLAVGRLHRIHRGVYAVGHPRLTRLGRWMAAVLAYGPEALLSHRPAAALLGLIPARGVPVEVTVPGAGRPRRSEIVCHGAKRIHPEDRAVEDGIPVTSVARTLLDLAAVVDERRLGRAVEAAERLRLFDLRAIDRLRARAKGHRGLAPLDAVLADVTAPTPTRSELERRFLDLCRDHGLPRPEVNVWVAGHEVDFLWRDAGLIVEMDSYAYHGTRQAFERDRGRDSVLLVAGLRVVRVTDRRIERGAAAVARQLRTLIDAGPPRWPTGSEG